jgi:hypothetical protein
MCKDAYRKGAFQHRQAREYEHLLIKYQREVSDDL